MLSIVVLGTAAGGGVPQWNCGCANCVAARNGHAEMRSTQASVAISADREHWFLINASPDLRQQLTETPALYPRPGAARNTPIAGVILTNGEVDAIAGLLTLREGSPFTIYAHRQVLSILAANSIFNALNPAVVKRMAIGVDEPLELPLPDGSPSGLELTAFAAPGKTALFLEGERGDQPGDTLGLVLEDKQSGKRLVFLAACAEVTPEIRARIEGAAMIFFDGTLWRDDEMIVQGLGSKTGRRMGHISMEAAIPALEDVDVSRRFFLHINNSNPALRSDSPERGRLEQQGWRIPADGMEIEL